MASGSMRDIRRRIKSAQSAMQITRAMELAASSKLRRAKERADSSRPYFNTLYNTVCEIQRKNPTFFSPFVKSGVKGKSLLIVIAGDKGLAGGYNSNVLRLAESRAEELGGKDETHIIAVGKKAVEYFEKRGFVLTGSYYNFSENISIDKTSGIGKEIAEKYSDGIYARAELFYTEYVSALCCRAVTKKLLPVGEPEKTDGSKAYTVFEPSEETVFGYIIPQYLGGMIFGACAESFACEQASRKNAMKSANDNASEMINELSLMYNRARQSIITREINEIAGGAESMK